MSAVASRRFVALSCAVSLGLVVGCGKDNSNSVSAPPAEMTPEQHAADVQRQTEHYAAPSDADRRSSSN